MRLLNSSTIKLQDFIGENVPDFAILSHKWTNDEVLFQDLINPSESLADRAGYKKIKACCNQAASDGFEYVWIDTCCIDKTSSAELSETINSMYRWYQMAQVCYAYLADVPSSRDHHLADSAFARSKWFTRGWTLQELLAPAIVTFFDQNWTEIGTKSSLRDSISVITGISSNYLANHYTDEICVGQKMSWASKRHTTRVEDAAYCLMGLFGVNMPLIYGEGDNAFMRLQLEILKVSTDHSLFAWKGEGSERGLLARSPAEFVDCGQICEVEPNWTKSTYAITNKGLRISLRLKWFLPNSGYMEDRPRECGSTSHGFILGVLDCQRIDKQEKDFTMLAIQLEERRNEGRFVRVNPSKIESLEMPWILRAHSQEVYFKEQNQLSGGISRRMKLQANYMFYVKLELDGSDYRLIETIPPVSANVFEEIMLAFNQTDTTGLLYLQNNKKNSLIIFFGTDDFHPWCDLVIATENQSLVDIVRSYHSSLTTDSTKTYRRLHLDRICEPVPDGLLATVALRRGRKSGQRCYFLEITVKPVTTVH